MPDFTITLVYRFTVSACDADTAVIHAEDEVAGHAPVSVEVDGVAEAAPCAACYRELSGHCPQCDGA